MSAIMLDSIRNIKNITLKNVKKETLIHDAFHTLGHTIRNGLKIKDIMTLTNVLKEI